MKSQRRLTNCLAILAVSVLVMAGTSWAEDTSDVEKRIQKSADVLNEIMGTPDKAIPDKVMSDAKCIAVVPSMVKIAVGFGGNHGKGIATCRTEHGWSAPAPITVTGGSWGLQLGGQAIDLVMVITNDGGMQHLLASKFKIGADASAAAGPKGRTAEGATDIVMTAEILSYSRNKGLFAGIDLDGTSVSQNRDDTQIYYSSPQDFQKVLRGNVAVPAGAVDFVRDVAHYFVEAKNR